MKLLLLCLAIPAAASAAESPESWTGDLPWTIFGPGGCENGTVSFTGKTVSAFKIEEGVVCEVDHADLGEPEMTPIYSKFVHKECGTGSSQVDVFDCRDDKCAECDDVAETEGVVLDASVKDVYDNVDGCLTWYPQGTETNWGDYSGNATSQAFDDTVNLEDARAYWRVFFGTACGEDWLDNIVTPPQDTKSKNWTGELPWTLFGPGGCEGGDVTLTGRTESIVEMSPGVACEVDYADFGQPEMSPIYSKFVHEDCGSESSEFVVFNCQDDECSSCDETAEAEGALPNLGLKEVYDNVDGCLTWYPKGTDYSWGDYSGNATSQAFDASADLEDTQAYWRAFFGTACGEDWLDDIVTPPQNSTTLPTSKPDDGTATTLPTSKPDDGTATTLPTSKPDDGTATTLPTPKPDNGTSPESASAVSGVNLAGVVGSVGFVVFFMM